MRDHFDALAGRYDHYRTWDPEPVSAVVELVIQPEVALCELGCGTGRYLVPLLEALRAAGIRCARVCGVDPNPAMLGVARRQAPDLPVPIEWRDGAAEATGLPDRSMTLIAAFQSVHLFRFPEALDEIRRIAAPGALFVVYTRLLEQEREELWGRYFPGYVDRSPVPARAFMQELAGRPGLTLVSARDFVFRREASLAWICDQTRSRHYSTLSKYTEDEFEAGYREFVTRLEAICDASGRIAYTSPYSLFAYRMD